jgi:acetyl esterase/lipase
MIRIIRLTMYSYIAAYLPSTSEVDRRHPDISPFYANLRELKCPPAIFTCGTLDPLLDDSVLMATKWTMSGADAVLKLYPGMLAISTIPCYIEALDQLTFGGV